MPMMVRSASQLSAKRVTKSTSRAAVVNCVVVVTLLFAAINRILSYSFLAMLSAMAFCRSAVLMTYRPLSSFL